MLEEVNKVDEGMRRGGGLQTEDEVCSSFSSPRPLHSVWCFGSLLCNLSGPSINKGWASSPRRRLVPTSRHDYTFSSALLCCKRVLNRYFTIILPNYLREERRSFQRSDRPQRHCNNSPTWPQTAQCGNGKYRVCDLWDNGCRSENPF